MSSLSTDLTRPQARADVVLGGISLAHLLNDLIQSMLIAAYPILKTGFGLSYWQIGMLTLAYQVTASLLQPMVGIFTDRRPQPWSLPFGMGFTFSGVLVLAYAPTYGTLVAGSMLLGIGSSIFHPEASRIARLSSGGGYGLAQSIFQVGGNTGAALGPLLVALVVLPNGRHALAWFASLAIAAIVLLGAIGRWYRGHLAISSARRSVPRPERDAAARRAVMRALAILFVLIFAKYFYLASFTSFFIFYLQARFSLTAYDGQMALFAFLAAAAAGTLVGGRLSDRIGTKAVIGLSFWGALPFSLALPHVGLGAMIPLALIAGGVISSAFSAIVVYAQDLLPDRVGLVSGTFFGLAFGMGGIGAAALGLLADHVGIEAVYLICSFLPLLGLLALRLPDPRR